MTKKKSKKDKAEIGNKDTRTKFGLFDDLDECPVSFTPWWPFDSPLHKRIFNEMNHIGVSNNNPF